MIYRPYPIQKVGETCRQNGNGDVAQETAGKAGRVSRTDAVDAHVGQRIRARRVVMGFSQEKLANALGLTFQQVQKYEKGANRVGASRLFDLARVLEVPVAYFFDGLPAARPDSTGDIPGWPMAEAGLKRETLDLLRAYNNISDPVVRRRVFDLARTLADTDPAPRH